LEARQEENEPKNCNQRYGWQDPTYIAWKKPIDFTKLLTPIKVHLRFLKSRNEGCKYANRSQRNYFTKGMSVYFNLFSFFHMKEFLNEYFSTCY
jgi:hypothetical protein